MDRGPEGKFDDDKKDLNTRKVKKTIIISSYSY